LRPRHIQKLLAAHLSPVILAGEALSRLGRRLTTPGAMPQDIVYLSPAFTLIQAVSRVFSKPGENDIDFSEARKHLASPKLFLKQLTSWNPMRDGSVAQLRSAESLLLTVWASLHAGGLHPDATHDENHRILFAWASLATSLSSVLETAQKLAPVHAAVKAAADGMKRSAEESSVAEAEEAAWLQVRQALNRPGEGEPWWWLSLIGCVDPKGFYTQHGLAVDGKASGAPSSPAKTASKAPAASSANEAVVDNAVAEAKSPAASPTIKASPSSPVPAAAAPAGEAEDSFAFEGEERAPAQQLDNTFAESEKDPYNDTFDAEGEQSPEAGGSLASPGLSPNAAGQYSQDDFELEADRSPAKGEQPNVNPDYTAEFEDADFEQESPPPTAPAAGEESNDAGLDTRQSMEDFEDDDLKRHNSKYSTGEFEFEADESEAKAADKPKAQDNDDGDFEADDEYGDFEDEG